ncbi:FUSC family protein [Microbacterium sp.]|uniref:FUSC family protein n=1 Tax=Microbacterium sp. TaxID=51671 RepID=UPI003C734423
MTGPVLPREAADIAWHWSFFVLGAIYALPAMIVIPFSPAAGLGLAVGVLPVAAFNLPRFRRGRRAILLVGCISGACFVVGSLLTQRPVLAVVAMFLLGVGFALWGRVRPAGRLAMALCLPLIGIGLSFDDVALAATVAGLMVLGAAYAWGIAMLWPEHQVPLPVRDSEPTRQEMLLYGVLLGGAAATATAIGYALQLEHVGWVTGAALMVMRPVREQLILRSVSRSAAVVVGAFAAASFALLTPSPLAIAVAIGLVIAALSATQASRWYIAPAFTTFVALTLILQAPGERPGMRFVERTVETAIGVGVALVFGALIPALIRLRRSRRSRRSGRSVRSKGDFS